jgi:hypothetical protein
MKREDLIRQLEQMGCNFIRHGGKHDWYHGLAFLIADSLVISNIEILFVS